MNIARIIAVIAVATGLGTAAQSAGARAPKPATDVSRTWAGYVVTHPAGGKLTFTSVTATWTQPKVTCHGGDAGARFGVWVGLGGYSPGTHGLQQTGVDSDCSRFTNRPASFAWYEITPAYAITLSGYKIQAGDTITATVEVDQARTTVRFRIEDVTQGWLFVQTQPVSSPNLTSAEWIVEAPKSCNMGGCSNRLADFGSVRLVKIATVGNGHRGTILDPSWQATALHLVATPYHVAVTGSTAGAVPGALAADGAAFTIGWRPIATSEQPPEQQQKTTPSNPLIAGPRRPAAPAG